ncbi:MAG: UvrB/UvrC motif-containing protein, partial [Croceimicrobium sp.]
LRAERSLVQTVGRAARNVNGLAIMYAEKITDSMRRTIDETNRRRSKQTEYNEKHGMVPTALKKSTDSILPGSKKDHNPYRSTAPVAKVAEENEVYTSASAMRKAIDKVRRKMEVAAKSLDFIEAAALRDEMVALEERLKKEFPA